MPLPLRLLLLCLASASAVWAAESATAIGGRWSLEPGHAKPRYLFRDADREVDLFSYHQSDSNSDGIDEVDAKAYADVG